MLWSQKEGSYKNYEVVILEKEKLCPHCLNKTLPEVVDVNFFGERLKVKVCRRCKLRLDLSKYKGLQKNGGDSDIRL